MKRPLAYITAAWYGGDSENAELAAQYCRAVYEAGFSPICPALYLPLFLNDAVPEEHKSGIDIGRDLLRRKRRSAPLPLILGKKGECRRPNGTGVAGCVLDAARSAHMCSEVFHNNSFTDKYTGFPE